MSDLFRDVIDPGLNGLAALASFWVIFTLAVFVVIKMVRLRRYPVDEVAFLIISLCALYAMGAHVYYWFGVVTDMYPVNSIAVLRPVNKYWMIYIVWLSGGIAMQLSREISPFYPPTWVKLFRSETRNGGPIDTGNADNH